MADLDRLRHLLTEAESQIMPLVSAPGAEATAFSLQRRRKRRRAAVSVLATLITLLGCGVAAWSRGPVQPPAHEPLPPSHSPSPTVPPSEQAQAPATTTPTASACLPPIISLDFNNVLDPLDEPNPHLRITYRISDNQTFCGDDLIETWVVTAQLQGNRWVIETASLSTFHLPGLTGGMPLPIAWWCGVDQQIWVFIGPAPPQSWADGRSPAAQWTPGRSTGAIRITEPTESCELPSPTPTATP